MKNIICLSLIVLGVLSCRQEEVAHADPTHNFTVKRLLILNDKGEVLMEKDAGSWYTPSYIYNQRQFVKEGLDSLAQAFGITITNPQLRGYFSYKYEYHPYATLRAFYVAQYRSGTLQPAGVTTEVKWMPIAEAIAQTPVESMKWCTQKILENPRTLWGASFSVYRDGEHHRARLVEDFYPLLE